MVDHSAGRKLKVFISYSRQDSSALADEIVTGLELLGFEPFLDRHDIAAGEDWEARLAKLIQAADTVVFVISPKSVQSERCQWEVDKSLERSKRLIPVLGHAVPDADVPGTLTRLNYIYFTQGQSFARALGQLADALRVDLDWIREHTRLAELAARWLERKQPEALLLRSDELAAAQAWMAARAPEAPDITDPQRAFIGASADAEELRSNRERTQIEEMARAQSARAEALAEREAAVRQLSRRTTMGLVGAGSLTVAAGSLAYWAMQAEERFRRQRKRADEAHAASVDEAIRREASRTDIQGQLSAYAASPGQHADDGVGTNSPYTTRVLEELSKPKVALHDALMHAHVRVLNESRTNQRPFLSSDMNGHIYLQQNLTAQRRVAVLASENRYWDGNILPNVKRDAEAWRAFLERYGQFETIMLESPTIEAYRDALRQLRDKLAPRRSDRGLPIRRVALEPVQQKNAPPNTLALFFFAGIGGYERGSNFLLTRNTKVGGLADVANATRAMMPVTQIQAGLREAAAASVLILDTNFTDIEAIQRTGKFIP
jgi:hypothetical protein